MLVTPDSENPGVMRQVHGPSVREAAYSALLGVQAHDRLIHGAGVLFDRIIPALASLQAAAGIPPEQRVDYRKPRETVTVSDEVAGPDMALMERPDGSKFWTDLDKKDAEIAAGNWLVSVGPKPPTQGAGIAFIPSEEKVMGKTSES